MTASQSNRSELEQALQSALDAGPTAIGQQVRYILALSRSVPPSSAPRQLQEESLTPAQARLLALVQAAETLSETQLNRLLKEASQITHAWARLEIMIGLAFHLPLYRRQGIVSDVWAEARRLDDPATRARVLFRLAALLNALQDEHAAPASLLPVLSAAQAITNTEARIRGLTAIVPRLPHAMRVRMLHRIFDDVDRLPNDRLRCSAITTLAEHIPPETESRMLRSAESIQSPAERVRTLTMLSPHLPPALQPRLRADALDAVQTISNEEERAEALIAFVPHLEYQPHQEHVSLDLEQALAIALGLSRRHLRARALAALSSRLMPALQSEALAAIHSLNNEREQAVLLAQLAPALPEDVIVASIGKAHTMREPDARVQVLAALARYAPESTRTQTARDVLEQALTLSHPYERVTALIAVADILQPALQQQAYSSALDNALLIENDNARARALSVLGPHLPPGLMPRALEAVSQFALPQHRMSVLVALTPSLNAEERHATLLQLLESAREIQLDYKRARALVSLAPLLPPDLLLEAQALADQLSDPYDRVTVSVAVAQNLPPEQRPSIIFSAWTLIKQIEVGYDSASAIAAIAPYLLKVDYPDLIQTANSVIASIRDEYDRASAIGILVPLLLTSDYDDEPSTLPDSYLAVEEGIDAALSVTRQGLRAQLLAESVPLWIEVTYHDQSYHLWRNVALRLAAFPLADALACLGVLMPIMRALAGDSNMDEVTHSLMAD